MLITQAQIDEARSVIKGRLHRTPVVPATTIGQQFGAQLYFKCENLQRTGSFKPRGALNKLAHLSAEEKGRGLVAVALVIAARWNPFLALPVALLFGGSEAAVLRLQAQGVDVSSYLLAATPYVICILVVWMSYLRIRDSGGMPAELGRVFG